MKETVTWRILDNKLKDIIPKIKTPLSKEEIENNKITQCYKCKIKLKRKFLNKIPWRLTSPDRVCSICLNLLIENKKKSGCYDRRN